MLCFIIMFGLTEPGTCEDNEESMHANVKWLCNVKGVENTDKPTQNYHPALQFPLAHN